MQSRRTFAAAIVTLALFAVPLSLVAAQAAGAAAPPAATPPAAPPSAPAIELARALAWPVSVLVLAFAFRRPLAAFLAALGSRVNKLSLFKVEIELVPATAAIPTPLLNDIRAETTAAVISDSSRAMFDQVQTSTPADYAAIDIGCGGEWLTSRLFIGAVMLERMRGLRALVFVQRDATTRNRFLAVAPVSTVRWALARRYPHLEVAWARAYFEAFVAGVPYPPAPRPPAALIPPDPAALVATAPPIVTSETGALRPDVARPLVARFIDSVQRPHVPPAGDGWVELRSSSVAITVDERAEWVTEDLLRELLPADAFNAWCDLLTDAPRSKRTRAVLRRAAPYLALTQDNREFVRLVDRAAFVEQVVAPLAEEPE